MRGEADSFEEMDSLSTPVDNLNDANAVLAKSQVRFLVCLYMCF